MRSYTGDRRLQTRDDSELMALLPEHAWEDIASGYGQGLGYARGHFVANRRSGDPDYVPVSERDTSDAIERAYVLAIAAGRDELRAETIAAWFARGHKAGLAMEAGR